MVRIFNSHKETSSTKLSIKKALSNLFSKKSPVKYTPLPSDDSVGPVANPSPREESTAPVSSVSTGSLREKIGDDTIYTLYNATTIWEFYFVTGARLKVLLDKGSAVELDISAEDLALLHPDAIAFVSGFVVKPYPYCDATNAPSSLELFR